jgi:hypothetical protein
MLNPRLGSITRIGSLPPLRYLLAIMFLTTPASTVRMAPLAPPPPSSRARSWGSAAHFQIAIQPQRSDHREPLAIRYHAGFAAN